VKEFKKWVMIAGDIIAAITLSWLLVRRVQMSDKFILVLITAPTLQVGEQIAAALVENHLAACVNILPEVSSVYAWKGDVHKDQEVMLVVKSREELFEDHLAPAVQAIHPYEVPEIIALPNVMGLGSYLDWIRDETST
jgi:periplasmic divalent cation tolerance protein